MSEQPATKTIAADGARAPMMSDELRADLLLRLKKVSGQVNGVAKMVEQDRFCADVLQQLTAAQSALEAISRKVARNYLERCVTDAVNHGDPLIYDEVMRVVFRNR
jgi:DNA-binding FrmR family transcriptional regulator